jgi:hypothetical protein
VIEDESTPGDGPATGTSTDTEEPTPVGPDDPGTERPDPLARRPSPVPRRTADAAEPAARPAADEGVPSLTERFRVVPTPQAGSARVPDLPEPAAPAPPADDPPAPTERVPTGPAPVSVPTGPAPTEKVPTGPAPTEKVPTGPAPDRERTRPVSVPTGPMPAPTGRVPTVPAADRERTRPVSVPTPPVADPRVPPLTPRSGRDRSAGPPSSPSLPVPPVPPGPPSGPTGRTTERPVVRNERAGMLVARGGAVRGVVVAAVVGLLVGGVLVGAAAWLRPEFGVSWTLGAVAGVAAGALVAIVLVLFRRSSRRTLRRPAAAARLVGQVLEPPVRLAGHWAARLLDDRSGAERRTARLLLVQLAGSHDLAGQVIAVFGTSVGSRSGSIAALLAVAAAERGPTTLVRLEPPRHLVDDPLAPVLSPPDGTGWGHTLIDDLAVVDGVGPARGIEALVRARVRRGSAVVLDAGVAGAGSDLVEALRVADRTAVVMGLSVDRAPEIRAVAQALAVDRPQSAGIVVQAR